MSDQFALREVPSRLLSAKKSTRLVLKRDAEGLRRNERVRSAGALWQVDGFIHRTGDVVLSAAPPDLTNTPRP